MPTRNIAAPHRTLRMTVACVCTLLLALSGCAADSDTNDAPRSETSTTSPKEEPGGESPSATTPDAEDSSGDEVPAWLATGFPLYPGSEVAGSGEVGGSLVISFYTDTDDDAELYAWFREHYATDGWAIVKSDDEYSRLNAEHADGRKAEVNVTEGTYMIKATRAQ